MPNGTRISLRAARINANMTQDQAAKELSKYFGMKISRQRVMRYEDTPQQTPPGFGQGFATIYHMPIEAINFKSKST
ncbi:XRE family transcriptional regulator [Limosilactobacillus sp. RRLNB_1_1]|uniref:XRE family transcriptional regulator n=1 Tax=Limosilactobacillus albertensis TaxID=2759752 RepID=A0A7W3Y8A8_9LACO|nr:XRE family transcriptional regulator [Limosilactobacillus albertensis]MBB1069223.1 XRE family transcriptional regulator [Limosilactobacillus albertensis]MCD7118479.1 helix-turn-helix domain-containing protein [Limosilactobacillus albertensis]MCD7128622.1 helix-turn-helix domain-containing protein [Limosilactobacillus albertensis]